MSGSRPYQPHPRGDGEIRRWDNRNDDRWRDRYSKPADRRQYSSPSPRRYSPPHDRSRTPPSEVGFKIRGQAREWDARRERDDPRYDIRRERSPSPRPRARNTYRDRDQEGYRSSSYDEHSRSPSARRNRSPHYGGPPSREVMMDGLPVDMTEEDITKELQESHNVDLLDDVRVIKDRVTRVSRGFGFLRFPSLEKSKSFVEKHYPNLYLYGKFRPHGDAQAAKVRIAYSRERDERSRAAERLDGEWTCKICTFVNFAGRVKCHKCSNPQINMSDYGEGAQKKPSEFANSGDSDVSPDAIPSQFLILRGLEPTATEELVAKGVTKLYKPSERDALPAVKKGNAKVASTTGDANLGAREGSLRRILLVRDRRSNDSWRYAFAEFATVDDARDAMTRFNSFDKFTISSKPVVIDYIHAGVFVPELSVAAANERFCFSPLANPAVKLVYWDKDAYANELAVSNGIEEKPKTTNTSSGVSAFDEAAAAAEKEGLVPPGDGESKSKKRKADVSTKGATKKAAPAHLQFWSNRHAELHGVKPTQDATDQSSSPTKAKESEPEAPTEVLSYADLKKRCCYLCLRQFKSEAEVHKHERLSQMHRDNLKDDEIKAKAVAKLEKAGVTLIHGPAGGDDAPRYRDRAKERQQAFGNQKRVSLPMKKNPATTAKDVEQEEDQPATAPSKGASLLGKMGWSSGEGLGAQGTGMTAPIATELYAQGVGLGAQGGKIGDATKEAEANTKSDYNDFLAKTKDKAKERFENMG